MNNLKLFYVLIIASIGIICPLRCMAETAKKEQPIELKLNLQKGDKFKNHIILTMKCLWEGQNDGRDPFSRTWNSSVGVDVTTKILDVNEEGLLTLHHKRDTGRESLSGIDYESAESNDAFAVYDLINSIAEFVEKVTPDGERREISILNQFQLSTPGLNNLFFFLSQSDSLDEVLFPKEAIFIGDKWTIWRNTNLDPGLTTSKFPWTYTLEES